MLSLTPKQEEFCHKYIEFGDASKAYRTVYFCQNMKPATVNRKANALLKQGKIRARIKELQEELKEKSNITKERVLEELAKIGFSNYADIYTAWGEPKKINDLTPAQKASIKRATSKVIKTKDGSEILDIEITDIELHDKIKALERICKMLGFDSPEKKQIECGISFTELLMKTRVKNDGE